MDKAATPIIGKDVIESLTIGMYEDSKFIYREYIQNSADQIDKAVRDGLLKKNEGEIHISINSGKRTITIEDNATGISQKQVLPILRNIAQSTKQRGVDKGFRGIGRLGGLGYCSKLIFETTFQGESVKSIMTWDAMLLRKIINNRSQKEEATNVISEVTKYETAKESANAHYFKVTLIDVTNDDLLNVKEIRNYLSMVAPVPFSNKFIHRNEIYKELKKEKLSIDEYDIYINTERLEKGYTTYIYKGEEDKKEKIGEVIGVEFFKEFDKEKQLLFWGWYSLTTSLNEQMKSVNRARGFRLRKSNIQIGDEYTLTKLHREQRGNFYYLGEVHAFHLDLIPNSRRDNFIESTVYFDFEKRLRGVFHKLKDLYYAVSNVSSATKKIEEYTKAQHKYNEKVDKGFIDKKEHKEELEKLERKKDGAEYAEMQLQKLSARHHEDHVISKVISRVIENKPTTVETLELTKTTSRPKLRTDTLASLSKEERKFLNRIFSIVRDVLDETIAEQLINKIEEELK